MIFQERENGHVIQDSVERGEVPDTQSEIKNFIYQCFKRKSGQVTPYLQSDLHWKYLEPLFPVLKISPTASNS